MMKIRISPGLRSGEIFSIIEEINERAVRAVFRLRVLPQGREISAPAGASLLEVLRGSGFQVTALCGGQGTCGKCRVIVDGREVLACHMAVDRDMTVELPAHGDMEILSHGPQVTGKAKGYVLALDIGTTTLVCSFLDKDGKELAVAAAPNPQAPYGADVVTRIRAAMAGKQEELTAAVRGALEALALECCAEANVDPGEVTTISLVGNPCMRQLFLGIPVENLGHLPFSRAISEPEVRPCGECLPAFSASELVLAPDIGPFVGTDTLGCILSAGLPEKEVLTLLVDIGTNGEIVLGNSERLLCCATAAGPALEGAGISCGMTAKKGAIDRVWVEEGRIKCRVIGGGEAEGICGSGLIDAVAAALALGMIDKRGRILNEERSIPLTGKANLTQEDIRQFQLAKGAVHGGIRVLAKELGIELEDIGQVLLAGGFGSFLDPERVCRVGLLPEELRGSVTAIGNSALAGAKLLGLNGPHMDVAADYLELGSHPAFSSAFARAMGFREDPAETALALGFDTAVPLDPKMLEPRDHVRAMCAQDKCRAYGKNWTCPPACGSLEQCRDRMQKYKNGLLLQTVGHMRKDIDSRCCRDTERRHLEQLRALTKCLRRSHPGLLALGAGGCRICQVCAYPEPCRFPDRAEASMEAYGLFVTEVCRDRGAEYHHGPRTVTYTACILY